MVYPDVTAGMNINELSLSFNINQQAFQNASSLVPFTQKIQLLAESLEKLRVYLSRSWKSRPPLHHGIAG